MLFKTSKVTSSLTTPFKGFTWPIVVKLGGTQCYIKWTVAVKVLGGHVRNITRLNDAPNTIEWLLFAMKVVSAWVQIRYILGASWICLRPTHMAKQRDPLINFIVSHA